jgi:hypothetical protein
MSGTIANSNDQQREFTYLILRYNAPGQPSQNIGVFVFDEDDHSLRLNILERVRHHSDAVLIGLTETLLRLQSEWGPERLLSWMEETWSNALTLSPRKIIRASSAEHAVETLFTTHIHSV